MGASGAQDVASCMHGRDVLAAVVKISFPQQCHLHQKCARRSVGGFQSYVELAQRIPVVKILASRPVRVCYSVTAACG